MDHDCEFEFQGMVARDISIQGSSASLTDDQFTQASRQWSATLRPRIPMSEADFDPQRNTPGPWPSGPPPLHTMSLGIPSPSGSPQPLPKPLPTPFAVRQPSGVQQQDNFHLRRPGSGQPEQGRRSMGIADGAPRDRPSAYPPKNRGYPPGGRGYPHPYYTMAFPPQGNPPNTPQGYSQGCLYRPPGPMIPPF